jgi:hypothetical protein
MTLIVGGRSWDERAPLILECRAHSDFNDRVKVLKGAW